MNRARLWSIVKGVLGLAAGLALGLLCSWVLWPRRPLSSDLAHVRQMYQEDYVVMVSMAYGQEGDLSRAVERLSYLGWQRAPELVSQVAARTLQEGAPLSVKRHLARLAHDLGDNQPAIIAYVATPAPTAAPSPTPTATPTAVATLTVTPSATATSTASWTPPPPSATETHTRRSTATPLPGQSHTPRPTASPSPTPAVDYRLVEARRSSCGDNPLPGAIRIEVRDAQGKGMPGVPVKITWSDGEELFVTGLHPERGPGYADYRMQEGVRYALSVARLVSDTAQALETFPSESCPEGVQPGSWLVVFQETKGLSSR